MSLSEPQPAERTVRVEVPGNPYDVVIGAGVLGTLGARLVEAGVVKAGSQATITHDLGVPLELVRLATASLTAAEVRVWWHAGMAEERYKTIERVELVLRSLARAKHERGDAVIALGGGLVGDLVGFAAATYRRGVPFIQCPTTLLAMVDASVGGKTGVNLEVPGEGLIKNAVGAFHQPRLVLADTDSLASLPERQFRSGLAECIKHGLLGADAEDPGLFEWTAAAMDRILAKDPGTLAELIERNVRVKATIVAGDEREQAADGGRALLNLGHTFAHAIETLPGVSLVSGESPLLHGEAVALGLIAAAACSAAEGLSSFTDQIIPLLARAGLPTKARGLPDATALISRMTHDKKVEGGSLRLILPVSHFRCIVKRDPTEAAVRAGWDAIRG